MNAARPPRVLSIAGSDSGGGAGIQADLKTFAAHGVYGMTVITAITAQHTRGVLGVEVVSAELVARQIDAVFEDIGVDAVKIGMLATAEVIDTVSDRLAAWDAVPVVLDPVMIAKSGDPLLADDAVSALQRLLPQATLVTPNLPECGRLTGLPVTSMAERRAAAAALARRGPSVLLKGGHAAGDEVIDLLFDGESFHSFAHPRQPTTSTHGTGCTLSSAIAARLAGGHTLVEAVSLAIAFLQAAIAAAYPLGRGHGPVNHLFGWPQT